MRSRMKPERPYRKCAELAAAAADRSHCDHGSANEEQFGRTWAPWDGTCRRSKSRVWMPPARCPYPYWHQRQLPNEILRPFRGRNSLVLRMRKIGVWDWQGSEKGRIDKIDAAFFTDRELRRW